jgi:glycosyltransferase involved in cell wall biosynthesis
VIIGMVGARFAGLDGVSLEAAKVAHALRRDGYEFAWFAGKIGPDFEPGVEVPAARFDTPGSQALEAAVFGGDVFATAHRDQLLSEAARLEVALVEFIDSHHVDVLMIQNALAIPMQLPLGLAITNVLAASGMPAMAHHHDFAWERARFERCAVPGLLQLAFPPRLSRLRHVVINSQAAEDLERRRGCASTVLPNVMDFETEPEPGDGEAYRAAAGLLSDDTVLLQPTRVIPRKGIESTIELAAGLRDSSVRVVLSHPDDTDHAYLRSLERLAADRGVDMRLLSPVEASCELRDAFAAADFVCLPSLLEGFGNALIEACYYRKPVFVNRYPVYVRDIAPTGLDCIEVDGAVTREAIEEVVAWLGDPVRVRAATDANYAIGLEHFSYRVVRETLGPLLTP